MNLKSSCKKILFILTCFAATYAQAKENWPVGTVDLEKCVTESKTGQEEQKKVKETESQMQTLLKDRQKELEKITHQLNDPDFVDSLSPEAEKELTAQYQKLSEEYGLYQNQLLQVMQQTNMQFYETMLKHVKKAATTVSKEHKMPFIIRKDLCLSFPSSADITPQIVAAMDRAFDANQKKRPLAAAEKSSAKESQ